MKQILSLVGNVQGGLKTTIVGAIFIAVFLYEFFTKDKIEFISIDTTILSLGILLLFAPDNKRKKIEEKEDKVKDYVNRAFSVEESMKHFQKTFGSDEFSIAILHNGTTAISQPNFHLMKFSILFSVGPNSSSKKAAYCDQNLSLWIDNFLKIFKHGSFILEDAKNDADPVVREVYESTKLRTQVFFPLFKENAIIGFTMISYTNLKIISPDELINMKRALEIIEAKL